MNEAARSSRPRAGLLAILPLGFLLVGSLLAPTPGPASQAPAGVGPVFALTVVAVIVAAVVAGLARWIPHALSRLALTAAGTVTAGGSVFVVGRLVAPTAAWLTVPAVVVALGWGAGVYLAHGQQQVSAASLVDRIPERDRVLPAAQGQASGHVPSPGATWQVRLRSARMRRLAIFGVVVFGAAVWMVWGLVAWWWAALLVCGGVGFCTVMQAWSLVLVRIDRSGLTIVSQALPLSFPLVRVRPTEVLGAGSAEIDPMDWGGWGLRWSARHTAFVVRGGPGLVVHRRRGRPLAVEVPDGEQTADDGAALLRWVAGRAAAR